MTVLVYFRHKQFSKLSLFHLLPHFCSILKCTSDFQFTANENIKRGSYDDYGMDIFVYIVKILPGFRISGKG